MISNHLILYHPLLLLPSIFPRIRVFSNESVLCIIIFLICIYLCWLHWVFIAARGLSLAVVLMGFSLQWLLLLQSTGSRCADSVVVARRLSCSSACGILLEWIRDRTHAPSIGKRILNHWIAREVWGRGFKLNRGSELWILHVQPPWCDCWWTAENSGAVPLQQLPQCQPLPCGVQLRSGWSPTHPVSWFIPGLDRNGQGSYQEEGRKGKCPELSWARRSPRSTRTLFLLCRICIQMGAIGERLWLQDGPRHRTINRKWWMWGERQQGRLGALGQCLQKQAQS